MKNILSSKLAIFWPENGHNSYNCGSTRRACLNFVQSKGPRSIWKLYLWLFRKILCSEEMGNLGMKMIHPYNFGSILRIVLKFWEMKGAKRFMENHFNGLLGKKSFWG